MLAAAVAAVLVWFLGVDRSWFVEDCPSCGFGRDILQYRVLGIPVHERIREDTTLRQRVAADLGVPCTHPKLERWHKYRWWGLCICACPRISGTHRLVGDTSWYDDAVVAKVENLAETNPSLRDEFAERVLVKRDMDYWKEFVGQLKGEGPQQPAAQLQSEGAPSD
jgi:hypothetical protein